MQNYETMEEKRKHPTKIDPAGNLIKLSQYSFSKGIHKFFNKNLNIVSTQTKYNKKYLNQGI